jgi:hypothetical protein
MTRQLLKRRVAKAELSRTAVPDNLTILERVTALTRYNEFLFINNEHGEYLKRSDVIRAVAAGDPLSAIEQLRRRNNDDH